MFLNKTSAAKHCSIIACAILVSACSSDDSRRQANRDFDYLQAQEVSPLVIAPGLETPEYSKRYVLPTLVKAKSDYLIGSEIDVRSPTQILALSSLVHADEKAETPTVWFNSKSSQDNVSTQVWTLLTNFFADKNITLRVADSERRLAETEWFAQDVVFAEFKEQTEADLQQRYSFELVKGRSQRTIGLQVQLLEHGEKSGDKISVSTLSQQEQRRYAVRMLNLVNIYYEAQRLEEAALKRKAEQAVSISITTDETDYPEVLLNIEFDKAWEVLPDILEKLGMTLDDEDKIAGKMTVEYDAQDDDYWADNNITPVALDEDDYTIQIGEIKGLSSLTFYDDKKQPLAADKVQQLFISLQEAIKAINADK